MALQRPAVQSSEKNAAAAGRAVDGNRDPAQRSTCTLTQSESGPWWRVDLQDEYKIDGIAITSVDDKKTKLDGVEIWTGISEGLNDINNIRWSSIRVFVKCWADMLFSPSLLPQTGARSSPVSQKSEHYMSRVADLRDDM